MLSMRKNKRNIYWLMAASIVPMLVTDGRNINYGTKPIVAGELVGLFREAAGIEAAKVEFICMRVKDDVVVDSFDTVEAAQALVEKHIKGRKAKLYVVNSLTNEPVAFLEEA
jgi:hypothetical protein